MNCPCTLLDLILHICGQFWLKGSVCESVEVCHRLFWSLDVCYINVCVNDFVFAGDYIVICTCVNMISCFFSHKIYLNIMWNVSLFSNYVSAAITVLFLNLYRDSVYQSVVKCQDYLPYDVELYDKTFSLLILIL